MLRYRRDEKISYFRVISNSMFIAIVTAFAVALITTLAGYAFSKMKFAGNKVIYGAILACLAVPVAAVTSPLFATIKTFGLLDKHMGVIVPLVAFNAPMMLLMVKNYFDTITTSCNHPIAIFAQTKRFPLVWDCLEKNGIKPIDWQIENI